MTRWLLSPLLLMSGLTLLGVAFTQPTHVQQHHAHTITHQTVKAKHTTFAMPPTSTSVATIMPSVPSAVSLGLTSDKQRWITLAYQDAINAESQHNDTLFPMIFVKQIRQESGFQTTRPNGTPLISGANAIGIAQFEMSTAQGLGIDPYNPVQSLNGAARLMASYVHVYHSYAMALAAYNAGPGDATKGTGLAGAIAVCGATNFEACLPTETQNYINVILG